MVMEPGLCAIKAGSCTNCTMFWGFSRAGGAASLAFLTASEPDRFPEPAVIFVQKFCLTRFESLANSLSWIARFGNLLTTLSGVGFAWAFGLPLEETSVGRRGFRGVTSEMQTRLEQVGENLPRRLPRRLATTGAADPGGAG